MNVNEDMQAADAARLEVARKTMSGLFDLRWDIDRRPGEPEAAGDLARILLTQSFADSWSRAGLDARSRSLVTLGITIALGTTKEFGHHVAGALMLGISPDEIVEVLIHAASYCGAPRTTAAWTVARKILAARAADPSDPGAASST
jgi:alkylhydroperoxidase/carboxymuconolactone decarboxylase family protein YurZ